MDYRLIKNDRVRAQIAAALGESADAPAPKRGRNQRTWSTEISVSILKAFGLPDPKLEYQFCDRRWRFDFAWPDSMVALEVEGGVFTAGAHASVKGILNDINKYNAAQHLGWRVIRAIPDWMPGKNGLTIKADILYMLRDLIVKKED